jgi:hypothetical protein
MVRRSSRRNVQIRGFFAQNSSFKARSSEETDKLTGITPMRPFILSFFALTSSKIQLSITAAMKRIDLVKVGGFKANENIVAVDAASPEPAADRNQVVIDVKASAINPIDWKMAEYGFLLPESLPAALGCDIAGVVVKASDGAKT